MACGGCRKRAEKVKRIKNPPTNQGSMVAEKAKPHSAKMRFSGRGNK